MLLLALWGCQPSQTEESSERRSPIQPLVQGQYAETTTQSRKENLLGRIETPGTGSFLWKGSGNITQRFIEPGLVVSKGDLMGRVDCELPERNLLLASLGVEGARLVWDALNDNLSRLESVATGGSIPEESLYNAQNSRAQAEVSWEKAKTNQDISQLSVEDCNAIAPFDARVEEVYGVVGEMVSPGTPFALLLPLDGLRLEIPLPPSLALALPLGIEGTGKEDGSLWKLDHVGSVVDPLSGTLNTLWQPLLPYPPTDGLWMKLALSWGKQEGTLVPDHALIERDGSMGVWILVDGLLAFRAVEIINTTSGFSLVQGLRQDDYFVSSRPGGLREGMEVRFQE